MKKLTTILASLVIAASSYAQDSNFKKIDESYYGLKTGDDILIVDNNKFSKFLRKNSNKVGDFDWRAHLGKHEFTAQDFPFEADSLLGTDIMFSAYDESVRGHKHYIAEEAKQEFGMLDAFHKVGNWIYTDKGNGNYTAYNIPLIDNFTSQKNNRDALGIENDYRGKAGEAFFYDEYQDVLTKIPGAVYDLRFDKHREHSDLPQPVGLVSSEKGMVPMEFDSEFATALNFYRNVVSIPNYQTKRLRVMAGEEEFGGSDTYKSANKN